MDENDDFPFGMSDKEFSDDQIEQLLQGKVDPQQAPEALSRLAELISAARMPATESELANEDHVLNLFRANLTKGSTRNISDLRYQRRRKVHSGFLAAKVAGVLVAATALTGTAVAAYHGDLPNTFQTPISTGLAKVGISVPHPTPTTLAPKTHANKLPKASKSVSGSTSTEKTTTSTTAQAVAPTTTSTELPANSKGSIAQLCASFSNQQHSSQASKDSNSVAQNLQELAQRRNETAAQLCSSLVGQSGQKSSPANQNNQGQSVQNSSTSAKSHGNPGNDNSQNRHFGFNSLFFNSSRSTSGGWNLDFHNYKQQTSNSVGGHESSRNSSQVSANGIFKGSGHDHGRRDGSQLVPGH